MKFEKVLELIDQADIIWTYKDIKQIIFADDLRNCELVEVIVEHTFHGYSLIKDSLNRLGLTTGDLKRDAMKLILQYPESYMHPEDRHWAIWDIADSYTMELLDHDSRIRERAGW